MTAGERFRGGLFSLGFWVSTIIFGLFAPLVLWPLGWHGRYRVLSQWTRFNVWWLGLTCGLRYRVHGREHLSTPGGVVAMVKHQSAWETIALQQIVPPQVWVLKRELMRIPFFGWTIRMVDPIPLDRSAGRAAMSRLLDEGRDRLARGLWVMIFPEGTRTPPGERAKYRAGGAILAVETGAPIVPIAHVSGRHWLRGTVAKRAGVIDVVIGPPIPTQGRRPNDVMLEVETWIESRVAELDAVHVAGCGAAHRNDRAASRD
ncbi:MAG: lysophospholipid acyltransferase family protein [Thioalkalivibrionaceae bacterium]